MEKLNTNPYKGVRDFYPEDKFIQEYIFEKMREIVESFGYEKYDASILESTDLYKAKSGEEIVNEQTYSFTDRGGRDVTLRPEMTPTIARMVAGKKRELIFPLRWYSIVNNFRYERPQKGRGREFWQLNVDIFGVKGIEAEIETITIAYKIMQNLGALDRDFVIKISFAGIVGTILSEKFNLEGDEKKKIVRLIDRWNGNKISDEDFNKEMEDILGKGRGEDLKKSLVSGEIEKIMNSQPEVQLCQTIVKKLNERGITNVSFDPFLVRGFDYYTGVIFEVFDKDPNNNRAMFGGGRYDNLLDIFGEEKIPAVGFGMGDMTALDFLESRNLLPGYLPKTDLYLCILEDKYTDFSDDLAEAFRAQGLDIAVDYSYKKVGDQIKKANKKKVPFVICIGDDEVKNDKFTLKRLVDGKEFFDVTRKDIKEIIEKK
ncbi:TPA: histidine--tRNA ligase [Candidatus Campbellbacteria bacterium]|nr:MAG: histidyl-tRNA synthetase, histidyl-tRNA synthetase [Candidatus Campbellbacteria bacterium GW2011_OD1_34_28]KKP74796.1 MAG: Histidine-tRNA ligase [Candidatus Campbellbacteria bacterium GW2011_GWD2_35_24]KKP75682.1 MAG: histidyl-tRNA synthetase [Candidatus Campbellbacteria bacterium GW2011_GWC2_35_28]KKP77070.1 MAG: histidyl-tRNA synthetase, histidyl-tRNA synthetase [Candidatus Campbellbacteria bacterium GW2011_GWC1_35_31]KKP78996.1 MAG: Histidine-tRNA ligase [Candidatus Campbellbacteria 